MQHPIDYSLKQSIANLKKIFKMMCIMYESVLKENVNQHLKANDLKVLFQKANKFTHLSIKCAFRIRTSEWENA